MKPYLDYYKLLGVKSTATSLEIKQAYHHIARQFHPDLHHNQETEEKSKRIFQDISEAYYILSDPRLREEYDRKTHRLLVVVHKKPFQNNVLQAGRGKSGHRKIIWTPYPSLNYLIDIIELGMMLIILALPFIAPFILIFFFLMFFRY